MKRLALTALVLLVPLTVLVGSAAGDHRQQDDFRADLNGYNEVNGGVTGGQGSVSTTGEGTLELEIVDDDPVTGSMEFTLTYTLENPVTVAHVHFAQRHVGGGVSFFFCGGGGQPACPPGTTATITGRPSGPRTSLAPRAKASRPGPSRRSSEPSAPGQLRQRPLRPLAGRRDPWTGRAGQASASRSARQAPLAGVFGQATLAALATRKARASPGLSACRSGSHDLADGRRPGVRRAGGRSGAGRSRRGPSPGPAAPSPRTRA